MQSLHKIGACFFSYFLYNLGVFYVFKEKEYLWENLILTAVYCSLSDGHF